MTKVFIYKFLRWITAWANLLDSIIAVLTLGTVWTRFGGKAVGNQAKYAVDLYMETMKNESRKRN